MSMHDASEDHIFELRKKWTQILIRYGVPSDVRNELWNLTVEIFDCSPEGKPLEELIIPSQAAALAKSLTEVDLVVHMMYRCKQCNKFVCKSTDFVRGQTLCKSCFEQGEDNE